MLIVVPGPGGHLLHHTFFMVYDKRPHGKLGRRGWSIPFQRGYRQIPMALILPMDFNKIREVH